MFCYFEVIFPKRSRSAKGEIAFDDDDDARVVYIVWYITLGYGILRWGIVGRAWWVGWVGRVSICPILREIRLNMRRNKCDLIE